MDTETLRLFALLAAILAVASSDCPPRQRQPWENTIRSQLLSGYNKYNLNCPSVDLAVAPRSITVDHHRFATMRVRIITTWHDPGLILENEHKTIKMNASEIWMPQLTTGLDSNSLIGGHPHSHTAEVMPSMGDVSSFFAATLKGICLPRSTAEWPRDRLKCLFLIQPVRPILFNLTHHFTVSKILKLVQSLRNATGAPYKEMQRMASWRVDSLESDYRPNEDGIVLVMGDLSRLPGQLEAAVIHPMCVVAALLPASAALPPAASARAALLALSITLHATLLLSLPSLVATLDGDSPPRNLLIYRDAGVLLLVMVVEWLLTLRLAARRRPLPGWAQTLARCFSSLRAPLLLSAVPTVPAMPARPADEQSVGLAEVLDRLTLFIVSIVYLGCVIVSLK